MKNVKHREEYVCKRWRMLTWLMQKGYKPIRTIPDVKRTDYVSVNSINALTRQRGSLALNLV